MCVHFGGVLEGTVCFVWFHLFKYLIQIYLLHLQADQELHSSQALENVHLC